MAFEAAMPIVKWDFQFYVHIRKTHHFYFWALGKGTVTTKCYTSKFDAVPVTRTGTPSFEALTTRLGTQPASLQC